MAVRQDQSAFRKPVQDWFEDRGSGNNLSGAIPTGPDLDSVVLYAVHLDEVDLRSADLAGATREGPV